MLRDAASVILLGEDEVGALQVYLCRRHRQAAFAAGAFVFPGGRVDEADDDPAWDDRVAWGERPAGELERALRIAALRELFEEAGVLLARRRSGKAMDEQGSAEHLVDARGRLQERNGDSFKALVEELDIVLLAEGLVPFAHWITPEVEPRRYDTRFFLARLPRGQRPVDDRKEVFEGRWLSPAAALGQHRKGELLFFPPTFWILEDLQAFATADEALAAAPNRVIDTVMPRITRRDDRLVFLLPGDPAYAHDDGPEPPLERQRRVVLADGRLRSIRPADA